MGGEPTHPPNSIDPLHPSSSRDPKMTPHISVSRPLGHIRLTLNPYSQQLTFQQLTHHLEERDAKMAVMRAQIAKLIETVKKKATSEAFATSRSFVSTKRRSTKDCLSHPNNERAHNKALVLRHGNSLTGHLSWGNRGDSS